MRRTPLRRGTKGLKRTPLGRGQGIARGTKEIAHESQKRQRQNRQRAQIVMDDRCAAADAPGDCFGGLTRHEVLTRARGGSITDPANIVTACAHHNTQLSQDVETMRWGYANDLLKHNWS